LNCCCGNGEDEQPQSLELLRVEHAVEQLEVVVDGDELALRDVAQVRARGEEDRRGELGQHVVGQVEVEVEAREVARLLALDLIDVELREHHAALGMVRVRQRQEARGERVGSSDLLGAHRGEAVPRHAGGQLHAHAVLHGFAARHRHPRRGPVGQVVALLQQLLVFRGDAGFRGLHAGHRRGEVLLHHHRRIAGGRRVGGRRGAGQAGDTGGEQPAERGHVSGHGFLPSWVGGCLRPGHARSGPQSHVGVE